MNKKRASALWKAGAFVVFLIAIVIVAFTIDLLTGLALSAMLTGDLGRRRALIGRWERAIAVLFGELPPDELVKRPSAT